MIEFMAHCSNLGPYLRRACCELVMKLATGPVKVVPHSDELYQRAFASYERVTNDKKWSLVDCASFEIMRDEKITLALTQDGHFTEAGFVIAT